MIKAAQRKLAYASSVDEADYSPLTAFQRFVWHDDCLVRDDLVFRVDNHSREPSSDHFDLFKSKPLLDHILTLLSRTGSRPRNVMELGIWDGGSVALWFELLQPEKLVALDFDPRGDSDYFKQYVASRGLEERIHTYWATDQGDVDRLREIALHEFDGPLDLVFDDASHFHGPTKASFETLFPLLRQGGLYIIEDWQWEHEQSAQAPDHQWAKEESLTQLMFQLVEATGTLTIGSIESLTIFPGCVGITRGWSWVEKPEEFTLEDQILRRSSQPIGPSEVAD